MHIPTTSSWKASPKAFLPFYLLLITALQTVFAQTTTLTFDDRGFSDSDDITDNIKSYNGYAIRYFRGGVEWSTGMGAASDGIFYDSNDGSGGSGGAFPDFTSSSGISIARVDGAAFDFEFFHGKGAFGFSNGMNITGYSSGVQVGSVQTEAAFAASSARTVTLSSSFDVVDSVYIDDNGGSFGFDAIFDQFVMTLAPLPVELLSFQVRATGDGLLATWQTASEEDADRFVLQQSTDGKAYTSIASLQAVGHSTAVQTYRHRLSDNTSAASYFRLKQFDTDGSFVFSEVVRYEGSLTAVAPLRLVPNPTVNGQTQLFLPETLCANTSLRVVSTSGALVLDRVLQRQNARQTIDLELVNQPAGLYQVTLSGGCLAAPQTGSLRVE